MSRSLAHKTKILLVVTLLTLHMVMPIGARGKPRGRKGAFGLGLLGGVVAGGMIGSAVARAPASQPASPAVAAVVPGATVHHFYNNAQPPKPDPKQMTVVETGSVQPNGCYQQTIREPVPGNRNAFTETVSWVCPTVQQVQPPVPPLIAPAAVAPTAHIATPPLEAASNASHIQHVVGVATTNVLPAGPPLLPATYVPQPVPVPAAMPVPAAVPIPAVLPVPAVVPVPAAVPVPVVPSLIPHVQPQPKLQPQPHPPLSRPADVYLVSKKTVYYSTKKSTATSISVHKFSLLILVMVSVLRTLIR